MSYLHFFWNIGGTTACISHKHRSIWILLTTEVEISVLIHLKSLGKEADARFLLRFGLLKLKHFKGTWLLGHTYSHSWNLIFMFLFIFKLLITSSLRNFSKFHMQGGLVSQALASKLLSHGFLSCQLQAPVHPLSPGSIYWSRKPCGCMQTPQHHHTEGMAPSAKARGEWFPSTALTAISEDTSTLSNTDRTPQWYPMRSHISPTLHQLQHSFQSLLLKVTGHYSSQRGLARMQTGDGNTTPTCDLLYLFTVFQAAAPLDFWYLPTIQKSQISLHRKPCWRLRHSCTTVNP